MSRTARIYVENACNHIIARGNRQAPVFMEDDDYRRYFMLLHRYKLRYGCLIYGYCLMPNHVHLVMESPSGVTAMSRFMHCVNQTYAMCFNTKYCSTGHLWQGRYKNPIVLKDAYLVHLMNYVEYNPVRAGITAEPSEYKWSSYRARVLGEANIILDRFKAGDSSEAENDADLIGDLKTSLLVG